MKDKIKDNIEKEKPFYIIINRKFAKKEGISWIFAFTQYPEAKNNIQFSKTGLQSSSEFCRYSNSCKDKKFMRMQLKKEIPYSKIIKMKSLPSEMNWEDPNTVHSYICNLITTEGETK